MSALSSFMQVRRLRRLVGGFDPRPVQSESEIRGIAFSLVDIWERFVHRSHLNDSTRRILEIINVLSWSFFSVFFLFLANPLLFVAPAFVSAVTILRITAAIRVRNREFDRDYPTFLTTLSSTVRTGMDPRMAFNEAAKLFPVSSPMYVETKRMTDAWNAGEADVQAVSKFASQVDHPDADLLRAATLLALSHGTSFSECLHRLARVTRVRQSFRRKVRAALAMQRLSAMGIGISAVAIAGLQMITNRAGLHATFDNSTGRVFLILGLAFVCVGIGWMMRIGLKAE